MADFRKIFFVLAGLLILISSASAQVTCTAFVANQPILRQEGITEAAGDIILNCAYVSPATPTTTQSISQQTTPQTLTLYPSGAPITSRNSNGYTEAALLINDCLATTQTGCGTTSPPIQGILQNGNLVFSGAPATSSSLATFTLPATDFTARITNVRVNPSGLPTNSFVTGTVLASFFIQNQSGLVLGAVQTSLSVTPATATTSAQCSSQSGFPGGGIIIKERVQTAFKLQGNVNTNGVGQWYQNGVNTESQTIFTTPTTWVSPGNTPGFADAATRFRVTVSGIPAGVTVYLPVSIVGSTTGTGTIPVIYASSGGDTGSFSAATGVTISGLSGTYIGVTSSGSVTYWVTAQNGSGTDSFTVTPYITYSYTGPTSPSIGTIQMSATYAPTSSETSTLIPRFVDTSAAAGVYSLVPCQTDLLFTFLTNQAGFDTGLEVANTSADPFGTANQNGTCTFNWFGTGVTTGSSTTTGTINAGTAYVNLVSSIAPGFQGYMIAVCNFQFAHGFAFVSDGYGQPGRGLSQGFLAQVIPNPAVASGGVRKATDSSYSSGTFPGEGLGN